MFRMGERNKHSMIHYMYLYFSPFMSWLKIRVFLYFTSIVGLLFVFNCNITMIVLYYFARIFVCLYSLLCLFVWL